MHYWVYRIGRFASATARSVVVWPPQESRMVPGQSSEFHSRSHKVTDQHAALVAELPL